MTKFGWTLLLVEGTPLTEVSVLFLHCEISFKTDET